jgi:DNA-binding GntR family transcriptional regulator
MSDTVSQISDLGTSPDRSGHEVPAVPRALEPLVTHAATLTDMVFESIKSAIIEKSLPPGSRVSEAALAAQLNVSKTPVRETLLRLRHIGLVQLTGSGLRVIKPSIEVIKEAYEHRSGLERIAAELAAKRVKPVNVAAIRDAASASLTCAQSDRADDFRRWDKEFHSLIARSSANGLLEAAIADSLVLTSVLRVRDIPTASGDSLRCGQAHVTIAQAIANGDHRVAADEMQHHIEHVMSMVLTAAANPQLH